MILASIIFKNFMFRGCEIIIFSVLIVLEILYVLCEVVKINLKTLAMIVLSILIYLSMFFSIYNY
jgi:hypothetical protein